MFSRKNLAVAASVVVLLVVIGYLFTMHRQNQVAASVSVPQQIPIPLSQNAAPLYDAWAERMKQRHVGLPEYAEVLSVRNSYTPEQLATARAFYQQNSDLITLLYRATERPDLQFYGPDFLHYGNLREAARELTSESYLYAIAGDYTDALKDEQRIFNIGNQLMSLHTLISYLVAVDAIGIDGTQSMLVIAGTNKTVDTQGIALLKKNQNNLNYSGHSTADILLQEDIAKFLQQSDPVERKEFSEKGASITAKFNILLAAATLLKDKAEGKAYPDTLPAAFPDPFSNKPLEVQKQPGGFFVYSTGPDGTFTPQAAKTGDARTSMFLFAYPALPPTPATNM